MLKKGPSSIRGNMRELMDNISSEGRMKAIMTIAKNNNISFKEAQFRQAQKIALSQARKK